MDLRLLARVLWRFRLLVAGGFLVAVTLTFLAVVRVDPGGSPMLSYRSPQVFVSSGKLFVTEPGFPWGRRRIVDADGNTQSDPGRLTGLAVLYSTFADSDPVKRILLKDGPVRGKIFASPELSTDTDSSPLPIIEVSATGTTPLAAVELARRASRALSQFIEGEQQVSAIPRGERVVLQTIEQPTKVRLLQGRPKVIPLLLFVGIMGLTIGLALLLENVRPVAAPVDRKLESAPRIRMPA